MNPQSNEHAGLNLPTPIEHNPSPEGAFLAPESTNSQPMNVAPNTPPQAPQMLSLVGPSSDKPDPSHTNTATVPTTIDDVPSTADDGDLIEKEWVQKAKQIVDGTRNDPYNQSKELTAIKIDYLHKRYNKNMKLSE